MSATPDQFKVQQQDLKSLEDKKIAEKDEKAGDGKKLLTPEERTKALVSEANDAIDKHAESLTTLPSDIADRLQDDVTDYFVAAVETFDKNGTKGLSMEEFSSYKEKMITKLEENLAQFVVKQEDTAKKEESKEEKSVREAEAKKTLDQARAEMEQSRFELEEAQDLDEALLTQGPDGLQKALEIQQQRFASLQKEQAKFQAFAKETTEFHQAAQREMTELADRNKMIIYAGSLFPPLVGAFLAKALITDGLEAKDQQVADKLNTEIEEAKRHFAERQKTFTERADDFRSDGEKLNKGTEHLKDKTAQTGAAEVGKVDAAAEEARNEKDAREEQYAQIVAAKEALEAQKDGLAERKETLRQRRLEALEKGRAMENATSMIGENRGKIDEAIAKAREQLPLQNDPLRKAALEERLQALEASRTAVSERGTEARRGEESIEESTKRLQEQEAEVENAEPLLDAQDLELDEMQDILAESITGLDGHLTSLDERKANVAEQTEAQLEGIETTEELISDTVFEANLATGKELADIQKQGERLQEMPKIEVEKITNVVQAAFEGMAKGVNLVFQKLIVGNLESLTKYLKDVVKDIPVLNVAVPILLFPTEVGIGLIAGAGELVEGLATMAAHPIDTGAGLGALIGRNPQTGEWSLSTAGETWKNMGKALVAYEDFESGNAGKGVGKVLFNVLTTATGGGAALRGVSVAGTAFKIARLGKAGVLKASAKALYAGTKSAGRKFLADAPAGIKTICKIPGKICKTPRAIRRYFKLDKATRFANSVATKTDDMAKASAKAADFLADSKLPPQLAGKTAAELKALKAKDLVDMGIDIKSVDNFMEFRALTKKAENAGKALAAAEIAAKEEQVRRAAKTADAASETGATAKAADVSADAGAGAKSGALDDAGNAATDTAAAADEADNVAVAVGDDGYAIDSALGGNGVDNIGGADTLSAQGDSTLNVPREKIWREMLEEAEGQVARAQAEFEPLHQEYLASLKAEQQAEKALGQVRARVKAGKATPDELKAAEDAYAAAAAKHAPLREGDFAAGTKLTDAENGLSNLRKTNDKHGLVPDKMTTPPQTAPVLPGAPSPGLNSVEDIATLSGAVEEAANNLRRFVDDGSFSKDFLEKFDDWASGRGDLRKSDINAEWKNPAARAELQRFADQWNTYANAKIRLQGARREYATNTLGLKPGNRYVVKGEGGWILRDRTDGMGRLVFEKEGKTIAIAPERQVGAVKTTPRAQPGLPPAVPSAVSTAHQAPIGLVDNLAPGQRLRPSPTGAPVVFEGKLANGNCRVNFGGATVDVPEAIVKILNEKGLRSEYLHHYLYFQARGGNKTLNATASMIAAGTLNPHLVVWGIAKPFVWSGPRWAGRRLWNAGARATKYVGRNIADDAARMRLEGKWFPRTRAVINGVRRGGGKIASPLTYVFEKGSDMYTARISVPAAKRALRRNIADRTRIAEKISRQREAIAAAKAPGSKVKPRKLAQMEAEATRLDDLLTKAADDYLKAENDLRALEGKSRVARNVPEGAAVARLYVGKSAGKFTFEQSLTPRGAFTRSLDSGAGALDSFRAEVLPGIRSSIDGKRAAALQLIDPVYADELTNILQGGNKVDAEALSARMALPDKAKALEKTIESIVKMEEQIPYVENILSGNMKLAKNAQGRYMLDGYQGIRDLKGLGLNIQEQKLLAQRLLQNSGAKMDDLIKFDDTLPAQWLENLKNKSLANADELVRGADTLLPATDDLEAACKGVQPLRNMGKFIDDMPEGVGKNIMKQLADDMNDLKGVPLDDAEKAVILRESMEYLADYQRAVLEGGGKAFGGRALKSQEMLGLLRENQLKLAHQTIFDRRYFTGSDHGVLHVIEADMRWGTQIADELIAQRKMTREQKVLLRQATIDHDMGYAFGPLDEIDKAGGTYFAATKDHPLYSALLYEENAARYADLLGSGNAEMLKGIILDHSDAMNKVGLGARGQELIASILAQADCMGVSADFKMMKLFKEPEMMAGLQRAFDLGPQLKAAKGTPAYGALESQALAIKANMRESVMRAYAGSPFEQPYLKAIDTFFDPKSADFAAARDLGSHSIGYKGIAVRDGVLTATFETNPVFELLAKEGRPDIACKAIAKAVEDFGYAVPDKEIAAMADDLLKGNPVHFEQGKVHFVFERGMAKQGEAADLAKVLDREVGLKRAIDGLRSLNVDAFNESAARLAAFDDTYALASPFRLVDASGRARLLQTPEALLKEASRLAKSGSPAALRQSAELLDHLRTQGVGQLRGVSRIAA